MSLRVLAPARPSTLTAFIGSEPVFSLGRADLGALVQDPRISSVEGHPVFHSAPLRASEGLHDVRIICCWPSGAQCSWQGKVEAPPCPYSDFELVSADLVQLEGEREGALASAVRIAGRLNGPDDPSLWVALSANGREVNRETTQPGEEFKLRWAPAESTTSTLFVEAGKGNRTIYRSSPFQVHINVPEPSQELAEVVDHLFDHFDFSSHVWTCDRGELVRRLAEREMAHLGEFIALARDVRRALDRKPAVVLRPEPADVSRPDPLRVLFVSWEPPGQLHGGGLYILNLLRHLGQRHEITLVHSYSPREESWSEPARAFVSRLVAVPRGGQQGPSPATAMLPKELYTDYSPAFRAAIHNQLAASRYDIVNYEYTRSYLHRVQTNIPLLLVCLEDWLHSRIASLKQIGTAEDEAEFIGDVLRLVNLYSDRLPEAFDHLVGLTPQDSQTLARYQTRTPVHLNRLGIDAARYGKGSASREDGGAPRIPHSTFVFLGNFRHPPNVEAARFFASRVLPLLRAGFPAATFCILGAFPTPEIEALAAAPGVTVTGFVEDYRPYLWGADIFVAPIFSGTGMRVKLLEALASGLPLVATGLAVQGLDAEEGSHFLRAETADEFVGAASRLLGDDQERRLLGQRARSFVVENHSSTARAVEREAIWASVVAAGR